MYFTKQCMIKYKFKKNLHKLAEIITALFCESISYNICPHIKSFTCAIHMRDKLSYKQLSCF